MRIDQKKLNSLSKIERSYLDIMMSGNSLYLRGTPGTAKSAIGLSIANKLGFQYIDKRLSQIDETDIGLYPVLSSPLDKLEKLSNIYSKEDNVFIYEKLKKSIEDISNPDTIHFAIPDWVVKANSTPTIIHLEELNRANVHVRNAALQILNERQIGDTKFNENVLIMSSGNYGELDGTEVDEMDLALSNRLCIIDHKLSAEEWISEYANQFVHPLIVEYIRTKPRELNKPPSNNEIRWASPRSWTNLSKLLLFKFGREADVKEVIIPELVIIGKAFIGDSITEFIRYCRDISNISIRDIIENWEKVKEEVSGFGRSRLSEIITNLKYIDLTKLNDYEIENIMRFLESIFEKNADELSSYLIYLLDNMNEENHSVNKKIIQRFNEKSKVLKEYIKKNLKK